MPGGNRSVGIRPFVPEVHLHHHPNIRTDGCEEVCDAGQEGGMKTLARHICFSIGSLILATAAVHAQTIAGTVTDASGAIMPGVTVEASSPALIEKTRTVVTDGAGQYRIVSLSPGVYTVTFSLTGFNMFIREAIELTTDFTANVDAV